MKTKKKKRSTKGKRGSRTWAYPVDVVVSRKASSVQITSEKIIYHRNSLN